MATIGFIGDVYTGPEQAPTIDAPVIAGLASVDLLVANLEGPVTESVTPAVVKGTHLRSSPESARLLEDMGVGVVSLANNHMFDYGTRGFDETAAYLDTAGISRVGAGRTLSEARLPLLVEVAGLRLGFLAYSSPNIETICATADTAGCAPLNIDLMAEDVRALSPRVDAAVVLLHWGLMGYELPTPEQRRVADDLFDAGATLVIGSHPHVLQGVAAPSGRLAAFSLGDFVFHPASASGRAVNQYRARQTGAMLCVELEHGTVRAHDLLLTRQRGTHVALEASSQRRSAIARSSRRLEKDPAGYGRTWKLYVLGRTVGRTIKRLAPWKWKTIRRGTIKGFFVAIRELLRHS